MKRISALGTVAVLLAACGGSDTGSSSTPAASTPAAEAPAAAATGTLQSPDWYRADTAANTVEIDLVAGATSKANYWNYNGLLGGEATVIVPEGATVTINLINNDPAMAHSVGVDSRTSGFPAAFTEVTPAFPGAVTQNPTDLTQATLPGETETITFVADQAGEYSLLCYIAGHAVTGMWLHFNVSADGEAGVRM